MTTKTKVILGLVGAAAAGVIVGLLVAPEKGADMRRKVGETASDWADRLSDIFAKAKDEVDNFKTKGTSMAKDAANKFSNVQESYS
jgi:gas vesicle protein